MEIIQEVTIEELLLAGIKMTEIFDQYRISKRDRTTLLSCMGAYKLAKGGREERCTLRLATIKQTIFSSAQRKNSEGLCVLKT